MTDRIGSSTFRLPIVAIPARASESRPTTIRDAFIAPQAKNLALDGQSNPLAPSSSGFALGSPAGDDGFQVSLSGQYPPEAAGGFFDKLGPHDHTDRRVTLRPNTN